MKSLLGIEKSPIKLSINLYRENAAIQAGQKLEGKVVMEVRSKKSIQGEVVKLFVTGREKVKVPSHEKRKESERIFCILDLELRDFCDRRLGPRIYTFPFSISLPEALPSSTRFKHGDVDLSIQYKIMVHGHKVTKEREFIVTSAPLPDERVRCMIHPVSQHVKSLNVVDQGILTLAASVKDTHIGRGDPLQVSISCRNDSLVDIQRVEAKVYEIVCGDIEPSREGNFAEDRTFRQDLYLKKSVKLKDLPTKRAKKSEVQRALNRPSTEQEEQYANIYEELLNDIHSFTLICPDTARDSYSGRLLHVKHFLKVKLMTNSVTDNPSVIIPLKIGNPPIKNSSRSTLSVNNEPSEPQSTPISLDALTNLHLSASTPALPPALPPPTLQTEPVPNDPLPPALPPPTLQTEPEPNDLVPLLRAQSAQILPQSSSLPSPSRTRPLSASTAQLPAAPPPVSTAPLYSEIMNIPLVAAVPVPENAIEASPVNVSSDVIVLGGDAILLDFSVSDYENASTTAARALPPAYAPSLSNLYEEMLVSIKDYDIIKGKLEDSGWRTLFGRINPNDFGNIIAHVNIVHDEPRVAALLAPIINEGTTFTCRYCVAAVKSASDWNRPTMVEYLLPFCQDIAEGHHLIRAELTEWDQVITARSFLASMQR